MMSISTIFGYMIVKCGMTTETEESAQY